MSYYDIDSTPNTPAMPPPKRSFMSPDDDSTCSATKLDRRLPCPCSRSLIFDTPIGTTSASLDNDNLDVLQPQSLLPLHGICIVISQAKRRRKMIANLPKLFDAILFLFQRCTVITKEWLIHKIIARNLDIVDRRDVEEQLDLILELVPEWISEKLASSGICYCASINCQVLKWFVLDLKKPSEEESNFGAEKLISSYVNVLLINILTKAAELADLQVGLELYSLPSPLPQRLPLL